MSIKYLIFTLLLIFSLNYKPIFVDKSDLVNKEIKVEIINDEGIETYKTKLGITVKDFLKENNLKGNDRINYNYTLTDNDVLNLTSNCKKSINNITFEELIELPYISEKNAKSIIEYRNSYGNFKSIDEIKKVKGIGDSKLKILKEYLTL